MVHVQLLGEDGYKDTLDHSTESTPFIPHPFAIFRRTHKKTPGLVFLHLFFFKKKAMVHRLSIWRRLPEIF